MRVLVRLIPLLLVVLLAGLWAGGRHADSLPGPLKDLAGANEPDRVVREAIDRVHRTYYREIPKSKLVDQAISGVVANLKDRFSSYFSPAEYRRFQQQQDSEFTGVGVTVAQDPRGLRVALVFDGSPAKRAGVQDRQEREANLNRAACRRPHGDI